MTAMFPGSGVPPADAKNSIPDPDTIGCEELWYSTSRCQPRFDPAAANATLAELVNLINKGEVQYNCELLNQVETSVRYLIQRGIPNGAATAGGPVDYAVTLDPPMTRYSNFMSLVLVPNASNTGPVRINVNGKGLVPVVRNDGQPLVAKDWVANIPLVISCFNGAFYHTGFVNSQNIDTTGGGGGGLDANLHLHVNDAIGNDNNDGTSNDSAHALKTMQKAIDKAFQYQPNQYGVYIHVYAGVYTGGAKTPNYAGPRIYMIGEAGFSNTTLNAGYGNAFVCDGYGNWMDITGFSVSLDSYGYAEFLSKGGAYMYVHGCRCLRALGANGGGDFFVALTNANLVVGDNTYAGNCGAVWRSHYGATLSLTPNCICTISGAMTCIRWGWCSVAATLLVSETPSFPGFGNVAGMKYEVSQNAVIYALGMGYNVLPGNSAGQAIAQGWYQP